jgi:cellulose biosynthesis protein BcsQ
MSRIATFYSYKGGTGRSMALANFAWILATSGKKVLVVDWDLEAPGLHRYFRPFLADPDLLETDGLIDTFWSLTAVAMTKAPTESGTAGERSASQDSAAIIEALDDGRRRLDWKRFPRNAYIDFIGAGRQGSTYSERVNTFDWKRFYELGGARLLTTAKEHLSARYDWVLIDSRTGVSDTSGICTIQMPSTVIACFTLNRQSIDRVAAILRSIQAFRSPSVDGSKIEFFPVCTRIENAEQRRLERARRYARPALAPFLPNDMQSNAREYWDRMEIAYRPAYAFEEVLAAFGDATDVAGAADSMLSQVEAMSRCITRDSTLSLAEMGESDRTAVLAKYALGTAADSAESPERRVDRDAAETEFLSNLRAKEQLWQRSQFYWRLLLSRRELDLITDHDRGEFGRNMSYYATQSERIYEYFRTIDSTFASIILLSISIILGIVALTGYNFKFVNEVVVMALSFIFVFVFPVVWVIGSIIANRAPRKPHDLRLKQVIMLTLQGPFRTDIYDYDPE